MFLPGRDPDQQRNEDLDPNPGQKGKENFISSVQTSGIRIRITGYSFRKTLENEKKNMLNHFYIS